MSEPEQRVRVLLRGKDTGYRGVQVPSDHDCWLVRLDGDRHVSHFRHKHGYRTAPADTAPTPPLTQPASL